jgi:hypothetical protein
MREKIVPHLTEEFIHEAISPFDVDGHIVRPDVVLIALRLHRKENN